MAVTDLSRLHEFAEVAKHLGFRKAAAVLGVSATALSRSIRKLETELGVRLIQRTTRAVRLTQEGETLLQHVLPALETIARAIQSLGERQGDVSGTLRITVPSVAYMQVIQPRLGSFLHHYGNLQLEISIDDGLADVLRDGFDAGIRLGGKVALDMVAVPLVGGERMTVVAAPRYLNGRSPVHTISDLLGHDCIRLRLKTTQAIYPWLLKSPDGERPVRVSGRLVLDSMPAVVAAAVNGCGIAYTFESLVQAFVERGELVRLLDGEAVEQAGWHVYFPSRREMSSRLRAFIDFFRAA